MLHTIEILRNFNFVEFCSAYWATISSLHPRLQTAIVKVVAAWEQVCYKLLIIGADRGLPIGQLGFDGKVGFWGSLGFMGGEIAQADYTGICHVRKDTVG